MYITILLRRESLEKRSNNIQCPGLPHFIHYINLYYYILNNCYNYINTEIIFDITIMLNNLYT